MKPCIYLATRDNPKSYFRTDTVLKKQVNIVNQYSLSEDLLKGTKAVILTLAQDQYLMMRHKDMLTNYLRIGGTIVVQGQVALPFLDCLSPFIPEENLKYHEFDITIEQPHPVVDSLEVATLNTRHGVRGFYSHGSNPPPNDATIISTMREGKVPVDWEWHHGKGRVFVHSGNDFWLTYGEDDKDLLLTKALVSWAIKKDVENG